MRKLMLAACALACLVGVPAPAPAGSFNSAGQFVGSVSPQVMALLAQFPQGLRRRRARVVRMDARGGEQGAGMGPRQVDRGARRGDARPGDAHPADPGLLLETFPGLADDVVFAARGANPAQKLAIGAGLADAVNYFRKCGSCQGSESRIATAMLYADLGTRQGFLLAEVPTLAQGIPGFNNAGAQTNGCVGGSNPINPISPSGPASTTTPPGC